MRRWRGHELRLGTMDDPPLASLSLTHVHYNPDDPLSHLCAYLALAPQALVIAYAALIWSTREVEILLMFAGQMSCEALNWLLKRWVKEERPSRMFQVKHLLNKHTRTDGWTKKCTEKATACHPRTLNLLLSFLPPSPSSSCCATNLTTIPTPQARTCQHPFGSASHSRCCRSSVPLLLRRVEST